MFLTDLVPGSFRQLVSLQGGDLIIHNDFQDQEILESNAARRELVKPGDPGPALDGKDELIYWIQAHPFAWIIHRKQYPQLHADLHSRDQVVREKAIAEIARQHPEWIVCAPKRLTPARGFFIA